ncbi:MAG TPA: tryptophan 7-halogenase, partial [Terricaulis sp.]|nr:tryptophan 7-halogenase [Terricaulis sp.]
MRRIVICGGGAAGWLSAAALAGVFKPETLDIRVIETPADAAGVGAGALPPEHAALHGLIGLSTHDLLSEADATFKLGTALRGWVQAGEAFIPFGPIGEGAGFHHFWRRAESKHALSAFALGAHAAPLQKFGLPPRGREGLLRYGLHIDIARYAEALRARALARGVKRIEAEIAGVALNDAGEVAQIALAGAPAAEADLFLDCTGADARILSALGARFEDWDAVAPCAYVGYGRNAPGAEIAPFTTITARDDGWMQTIPLQSGEAWAIFSESPNIKGAQIILPFRSGVRDAIWRGNCAGVGGAAGVMEPLHGLDLQMAHRGVLRLLSLLPQH